MIERAIRAMMHSPVHNYVIPGLTSWLIGEKGPKGCVRLFTMSRNHEEPICPHSHRFNFVCRVLTGQVTNRLWSKNPTGDMYQVSEVTYEGVFGKHVLMPIEQTRFAYHQNVHKVGEEYGMEANQIHSIYFSKGSEVLFFEGPPIVERSVVIEPVVDDRVIPLMKTEPWMFTQS